MRFTFSIRKSKRAVSPDSFEDQNRGRMRSRIPGHPDYISSDGESRSPPPRRRTSPSPEKRGGTSSRRALSCNAASRRQTRKPRQHFPPCRSRCCHHGRHSPRSDRASRHVEGQIDEPQRPDKRESGRHSHEPTEDELGEQRELVASLEEEAVEEGIIEPDELTSEQKIAQYDANIERLEAWLAKRR